MDEEEVTNLGNPEHLPYEEYEFPKMPHQWKEGHLNDGIDPSDVGDDEWVDSNGNPYNPEAGSTSPTPKRCNAVLVNYAERYGERRYCGAYPKSRFDDSIEHDYCEAHKSRAGFDTKAEQMLQHGMSARSRDHIYRKLPDWQRLHVYGLYETLLGDSTYEFGVEHEMMEFDFEDAPFTPKINQEGPKYLIEVPHSTENSDRDMALFMAALDGVKMELSNAEIVLDDDGPPMATEAVETAQLTSPTEADPTQEFKTLEGVKEHPLNMAYSRVLSDRKDLLQYGGVEVDGETSDNADVLVGIDSITQPQVETTEDTPVADRGKTVDDEEAVDLTVE